MVRSTLKSQLLISVIITTRNEQNNIGNLLNSLKKQTYKNFEIIVVDNNSTDQTKELSQEYTQRVYNYGPERSRQRNFGVKEAQAKYVLILDADMVLESKVLEECWETLTASPTLKALVVPEKSFGIGTWAKVKAFERSFYLNDPTIEAARLFDKKVFMQFKGYDEKITGPEDYDLPYRISKKYPIGRINSFILHNEGQLSLWKTIKKKYYYGSKASVYLTKHPELLKTQGNLLFRKAFFRQWRTLVAHPLLTCGLFFMRSLEMTAAGLGFIQGKYL